LGRDTNDTQIDGTQQQATSARNAAHRLIGLSACTGAVAHRFEAQSGPAAACSGQIAGGGVVGPPFFGSCQHEDNPAGVVRRIDSTIKV
jgi:hypothetical protein